MRRPPNAVGMNRHERRRQPTQIKLFAQKNGALNRLDIDERLNAYRCFEPIALRGERLAVAAKTLACQLSEGFEQFERLRKSSKSEADIHGAQRQAWISDLNYVLRFCLQIGFDHTQTYHLLQLQQALTGVGLGRTHPAFKVDKVDGRGSGSSITTEALNLARSYVASAVWCLHQAGLSVSKAIQEVDRAFDGRRLVDQSIEKPASGQNRVRTAYNQTWKAYQTWKAHDDSEDPADIRVVNFAGTIAHVQADLAQTPENARVERLRQEAESALLFADLSVPRFVKA